MKTPEEEEELQLQLATKLVEQLMDEVSPALSTAVVMGAVMGIADFWRATAMKHPSFGPRHTELNARAERIAGIILASMSEVFAIPSQETSKMQGDEWKSKSN